MDLDYVFPFCNDDTSSSLIYWIFKNDSNGESNNWLPIVYQIILDL